MGMSGPWSSEASSSPISPYTPLPDAYRIVPTPLRRIASTTLWVSAVPSSKSMAGSVMARAMSGFEARWMTTS